MTKFIQAFGSGRLVASAHEQKQAVETLLARLTGVRSARVETTGTGEIGQIHIVADGQLSLAEQRRRIRSALLAAHDLEVDAQRISLVPLEEDAEDWEQVHTYPSRDPRARLRQLGYQQEGLKVIAHLELTWQGKTFRGLSGDADTARGRMVAASRAALKALERVTQQRVAFFLEALDTLQVFSRHVVVASVRVVSDLRRDDLVGCARVREDPNYAAAQAVLAAVNRSFARLTLPTEDDE